MGLYNLFKKTKKVVKSPPTLNDDIIKATEWISKALVTSGYNVDFSLDTLKEIDRFFEENVKDGKAIPKGLLSKDLGKRLFAIGAYIGEVIRVRYDGEWITDDNDPNGEINISVKLANGTILWPVQKVMKRFKNGSEDSIYFYGSVCDE